MEVSFMPKFYSQGKSPWYLLDRRLGRPQSCSECGGKEKNSQPPLGIELENPNHPACSLFIISSELSCRMLSETKSKTQNSQIPILWVLGAKWPGCEADHSPPSSMKVKNGRSYTALPNTFS
jgi:hypothetical protein